MPKAKKENKEQKPEPQGEAAILAELAKKKNAQAKRHRKRPVQKRYSGVRGLVRHQGLIKEKHTSACV